MSKLQDLKRDLERIASDAKSTAGGLGSFKSKFSAAVSRVQAVIGGSAQRADQQIIQTLQAAEKQVDAAIQALQGAASTASRYAASL